MNEIATPNTAISLPEAVETALVRGDLSKLDETARLSYYRAVCQSLSLNPLTRPFEYITLNGKLTLYAARGATDQLRALRGVSVEVIEAVERDGLYIVRARARMPDGRTDEATGAVPLTDARGQRLSGEALANGIMKAETKAKRRVTLSICGLGWLDETEIETVPDAEPAPRVKPAPRAKRAPSSAPTEDKPSAPAGDVNGNGDGGDKPSAIVTELRDRLADFIKTHKDYLTEDQIKAAREVWKRGDPYEIAEMLEELEG